MMNRFGAQGWEIERVDRLGLVCLTALILLLTVIAPVAGNSGLQHGLTVGMPTGAALGLLLGVWLLRRQRQQMRRAARFPSTGLKNDAPPGPS
ncbi:hypothetical protein ACIQ6K_34840 [Streptomyces sp. NPDC096354]|uniref:hypothetical protein n=1 Tax=Streptomyces sp. NPDC096354 TaxID=3366088 RepID=UPI00381D1ACC